MDVGQRIGVEEQNVSALSGSQRSRFGLDAESTSGFNGRGLQRFQRRETGFHVELDLAMKRVARDGLVGSGNHGNAGGMKRAEGGHQRLPARGHRGGFIGGRRRVVERLVKLRRNVIEAGLKLIECAFADHEAAMERAASALSADEREQAARLLKKLGLTAQSLLQVAAGTRALSSNE